MEKKNLKFTYSVSKHKESGEYRVYKENEEHFIAICVFNSKNKKECLEYIKSMNKRGKRI